MKILCSILFILLLCTVTKSLHYYFEAEEKIASLEAKASDIDFDLKLAGLKIEYFENMAKILNIKIADKDDYIDILENRITQIKNVKVTAYTPSKAECGNTKGIGASGEKLTFGHIAVSRDLYNKGWTHGKRVLIKNMGIFTIGDKMGSSQKEALDIFMPGARQVAFNFGKQEAQAVLLD